MSGRRPASRRVRRGALRAVGTAVAVLALGCGGDTGVPPVAPVPTPTPTPTPTPPPVPAPSPPANLVALPGDARVTLRWLAPANPVPGERITHYDLRATAPGGASPGMWVRRPPVPPEYEFTDLVNGWDYLFEIRSVDDRGTPADPADDLHSKAEGVSATPVAAVAAVTWIGFAEPAVTLIEGGRARVGVRITGEPLTVRRFPVDAASEASHDQLTWSYISGNTAGVHYLQMGVTAVRDEVSETPATYGLALIAPPEGLPEGVAIAPDAGVLRVTVRDAAETACADLELTVSRLELDRGDAVWSGDIAFDRPEAGALRLLRPYADLHEGAVPGDPPLARISAVGLRDEAARDGVRRLVSRVAWSGELAVTGVAPGCEPVFLTCPDDPATLAAGCSAAPAGR